MKKNNDFISKNIFDIKTDINEDIKIETELLNEHIKCMCATDDSDELDIMYSFVKNHIENLFNYNLKRIDAQ